MSHEAGGQGDALKTGLKAEEGRVHREDSDGIMVFVVENENIYPKQADEIATAIKAGILSAHEPKALVDLGRVQFMASAFLGKLVELHKLAREKNGELKVCVTGKHVVYTIKLVKLDKVMEFGGDRSQLLRSFSPPPTGRAKPKG